MKKSKLKITIEFENEDGSIVEHTQEKEIDTKIVESIDDIEGLIITEGNTAMRRSLSKQLEWVSKKKLKKKEGK